MIIYIIIIINTGFDVIRDIVGLGCGIVVADYSSIGIYQYVLVDLLGWVYGYVMVLLIV
jgi:hypothetical protein